MTSGLRLSQFACIFAIRSGEFDEMRFAGPVIRRRTRIRVSLHNPSCEGYLCFGRYAFGFET
jgi:hypothetical protein